MLVGELSTEISEPQLDILFHRYLTVEEERQITEQFQDLSWYYGRQVLGTGVSRFDAQRWADRHNMQTLTTAMGP
jgi:hypothetical protein